MDLWDQLNREEGANQVSPHWRSKQIIASALGDYTCSSPERAKSVLEHMSNSRSFKLAKRLRFSNENATSDDDYPKVSFNMAKREMGKQPASEPENFATPDVYMGTRSHSGTARPINYRAFTQRRDK